MPGLVTAMAGLVELWVVDIARLAEASWGWIEVVEKNDGIGLVAAVDETVGGGGIPWLDTAMDVVVRVVVVVVVLGVEVVELKLDAEEFPCALLRAWYSAARFLSQMVLVLGAIAGGLDGGGDEGLQDVQADRTAGAQPGHFWCRN